MSAFEALPWDSNWMGFPVARYIVPRNHAADLAAVLTECRSAGMRLLYLVVGFEDEAAAIAARAAGAWLADEKLTYEVALPVGKVFPEAPTEVKLIPATSITPALEELARQSGEYSRYQRDPRIGAATFEALYHQWLRRTLSDGIIWTALVAGETRGMLAFDDRGGNASIELVAVVPSARRQHLGQHLVNAACREAQRRGYHALRVVTQGLNLPARSLYERCGFQLSGIKHVYHLWL